MVVRVLVQQLFPIKVSENVALPHTVPQWLPERSRKLRFWCLQWAFISLWGLKSGYFCSCDVPLLWQEPVSLQESSVGAAEAAFSEHVW